MKSVLNSYCNIIHFGLVVNILGGSSEEFDLGVKDYSLKPNENRENYKDWLNDFKDNLKGKKDGQQISEIRRKYGELEGQEINHEWEEVDGNKVPVAQQNDKESIEQENEKLNAQTGYMSRKRTAQSTFSPFTPSSSLFLDSKNPSASLADEVPGNKEEGRNWPAVRPTISGSLRRLVLEEQNTVKRGLADEIASFKPVGPALANMEQKRLSLDEERVKRQYEYEMKRLELETLREINLHERESVRADIDRAHVKVLQDFLIFMKDMKIPLINFMKNSSHGQSFPNVFKQETS